MTISPLGVLAARALVTAEMYKAGELFANMSHTLFGRRGAKAASLAEWIPGEAASPLSEGREQRTRTAYDAADLALRDAGAFCWHEVHRVCIDERPPGYIGAGPADPPPLLLDLRGGLSALARHWRMLPRGATRRP